MCHKIDKVLKLAKATFSRKSPDTPNFRTNLEKLLGKVDEITELDVGLDRCRALTVSQGEPAHMPMNIESAPVTYIPISEDTEISIGIFVVCEGQKIPLHDHPHMHGIIKCIKGQIEITSYNKESPSDFPLPQKWKKSGSMLEKLHHGELFPCEIAVSSLITTRDTPCFLEPNLHNIHEIASVNGPAAFLDILAPPYNVDPGPDDQDQETRDCQYYRVVGPAAQNYKWLMMADPPASFYCDTEPYQGPSVGTLDS